MEEDILDIDIENIQGIGPKIRAKLVDRGIETVLDLAAALPSDVEEAIGGSKENATPLYNSSHLELVIKSL